MRALNIVLNILFVCLYCTAKPVNEELSDTEIGSKNQLGYRSYSEPVETEDPWSKVDKHMIDRARKILKKHPVVDGHNDLAWVMRMDYNNSLDGYARDIKESGNLTTIDYLKKGGALGQFWAAYMDCGVQYKEAVRTFTEQIDVIKRIVKRYPKDLEWVTTAKGLEQAMKKKKIASMIGMESGHGIDSSLGILRMYYELGTRYLTLTHNCDTPWAGSATTEGQGKEIGLSDFGKKIIKEMNRLGMMVDLSHVSAQVMSEALEVTKAPVIFSHSAARAINSHKRNVPDSVLKKVAKNKGVVMVLFYTVFIQEEDGEASVYSIAKHINHIRKICGIDCVALGGDYNGVPTLPPGMEHEDSYPLLFAVLLEQGGWTEQDLGKLASGNIIRVWKEVEKVRDEFEKKNLQPIEDLIHPIPKAFTQPESCYSLAKYPYGHPPSSGHLGGTYE